MHFLWVKPAMLKLLGLKLPGGYEFYPKCPCKLTVGQGSPSNKKRCRTGHLCSHGRQRKRLIWSRKFTSMGCALGSLHVPFKERVSKPQDWSRNWTPFTWRKIWLVREREKSDGNQKKKKENCLAKNSQGSVRERRVWESTLCLPGPGDSCPACSW